MLAKRIIPCLDVDEGRVVKGTNFVDIVDAGDPVEAAIRYNEQGADELVFLDITASSGNRNMVFDIVQKTAKKCFMPLTVGGGVRELADIRKVLTSGGDKVAINTAAISNPGIINDGARAFGSQCIVVAMDVKRVGNDKKWEVFSHGGRKNTGIDAVEWAKECQRRGAGEILLTSMDADGTQDGYDLEITSILSSLLSIPVIASGGAGNLDHLVDALSNQEDKGNADAVLAASIFHFGKFTVGEVKDYLHKKNICVRL